VTSEAIDDLKNCSESKLRLKAMMGFLYKEAIGKLREGFFNLVGAVETANAIEKWVNKQLMKRIGRL